MFQCGFIFLLVATCCHGLPAGEEMSRQRRIIGGQAYKEKEYPFHVSLWNMSPESEYHKANPRKAHSCGGSLIGDRWVLTAAQCFDGKGWSNINDWKVYLGMYEQSEFCPDAQERDIENVYRPPEFTKGNLIYGDIALIKLNKAADLKSDRVSLAKLNDQMNCPNVGDNVKVIGWGKTKTTINSDLPKMATVSVSSMTKCTEKMNEENVLKELKADAVTIDKTVLCAGDLNGGVDSCNADGGSPLLATCGGVENVIVGTVSFGYKCAQPGYPAVYTRVSNYYDWIKKTMEDNA